MTGPSPLPACGYRIHTSQKPTLLQWVTQMPLLGRPVLPQSIQATLMTHFFRLADERGRIRCVHTIAACGERSSEPTGPAFGRPDDRLRERGGGGLSTGPESQG